MIRDGLARHVELRRRRAVSRPGGTFRLSQATRTASARWSGISTGNDRTNCRPELLWDGLGISISLYKTQTRPGQEVVTKDKASPTPATSRPAVSS